MPTFKIPRLGRPSTPARPDIAEVYVEEARKRLKDGQEDTDAMFTLAAWHAVHGEHAKSLAILHRLTQLDPLYPGVWRFKASVYREMGEEKMAWLCEKASDRQNEREG
jgi:Tfp pilus assembly protein PilF